MWHLGCGTCRAKRRERARRQCHQARVPPAIAGSNAALSDNRCGKNTLLGEDHDDRGTDPKFTVERQLAAMPPHHRKRNREAQPGSRMTTTERAVDLAERLERPVHMLRCDADPAVAYGDGQPALLVA